MTTITAADETAPVQDMTPMIDVVFLMIIFFLCIEFKTLEAKLPAFLPLDKGGSPALVTPVEQLSVRVDCIADGVRRFDGPGGKNRYRLDGHRVQWQVGPRTVTSLDELRHELARVATLPSSLVPDPRTGEGNLMGCVVEPESGVCYADVAATADAAHASGFCDITFGGGRGPRPR
ncbi:MAG: biopolymer transporter ExbD [Planctomycetes bacterium]|nr:biopolymer transporter ExbD [Planctomycetota bacterium]